MSCILLKKTHTNTQKMFLICHFCIFKWWGTILENDLAYSRSKTVALLLLKGNLKNSWIIDLFCSELRTENTCSSWGLRKKGIPIFSGLLYQINITAGFPSGALISQMSSRGGSKCRTYSQYRQNDYRNGCFLVQRALIRPGTENCFKLTADASRGKNRNNDRAKVAEQKYYIELQFRHNDFTVSHFCWVQPNKKVNKISGKKNKKKLKYKQDVLFVYVHFIFNANII